ncbi:MAG TPA: serine/threonine-protein kinase [Thermosynechococcaceae cyanobacterium]
MSDPLLPKTETLLGKALPLTHRNERTEGSRVYSKRFARLGHGCVGAWAILAAIVTATQSNFIQAAERQLQSLFFEVRGPVAAPRNIVILALDADTISQGKNYLADPKAYPYLEPLQTAPPKRSAYATAIERLMTTGARSVALDVVLDLPSAQPSEDAQLQKVLRQFAGRVTLAALYEDVSNQINLQGDLTQLVTPNALFATASQSIGFINFPLAPNGRIHSLGSFYPQLLSRNYGDRNAAEYLQQEGKVPSFAEAVLQAAQIPHSASKGQTLFFYGEAGTFQQVPFWQVLDPVAWAQHQERGTFKDAIVLIGPTATSYQDFHPAPFSGSLLHPNLLSGIEIHANAIATLMQNRAIGDALPNPVAAGLFVASLVGIAGYLQSKLRRTSWRFCSAIGLSLSWGVVGFGVFVLGGWTLPVAVPLVAIGLCGVTYLATGAAGEYGRKLQLRRTLENYVGSPIVREIISQQDDLQDLLRREQAIVGKLLAGRYTIVRLLGSGGFGETYVAEDVQRPGTPLCVVKQLRPASNNPKLFKLARRLFHREAETLEKLGKHPQIPQLLAYFEEEQEFYLVQELVVGHPLSQELSLGRQLPEARVVGLIQELLRILEFVHSQRVIHRDIKPSNIIIRDSDNKPVLIDFGAVKEIHQLAEDWEQSGITVGIGTQGYMPNEQCAGNPRFNSDIYAIGITAIQALTGLPPSQLKQDPDSGEILWKHRATVGHALAEVLSRMVRYEFTHRYQSVNEVRAALKELAIAQPTAPTPLIKEVTNGVAPEEDTSITPSDQPWTDADTLIALEGDTGIAASTQPWPDSFEATPLPSTKSDGLEER